MYFCIVGDTFVLMCNIHNLDVIQECIFVSLVIHKIDYYFQFKLPKAIESLATPSVPNIVAGTSANSP